MLSLVAAATIAVIVSATRSAMASNREIIEVLHFVGANERFISREFERHFLGLGVRAGLVGAHRRGLAFLLLPLMMHMLGGGVRHRGGDAAAGRLRRARSLGLSALRFGGVCRRLALHDHLAARRHPRAQVLRVTRSRVAVSAAQSRVSRTRDLCLFVRRLAVAGVGGEGGTSRKARPVQRLRWCGYGSSSMSCCCALVLLFIGFIVFANSIDREQQRAAALRRRHRRADRRQRPASTRR